MSRLNNAYRLLALAGVLTAVAWGCSTDSPTAPQQVPAPPPQTTNPTAYRVTLSADPGGIVIDDQLNTGGESARIRVSVKELPSERNPPDGTFVEVDTSLGSFVLGDTIQQEAVQLANGEAFLTLFAGGPPSQVGTATISAELRGVRGVVGVPIEILVADFRANNPDADFSVEFINQTRGNPNRFLWHFGDETGRTSTAENPRYEFPSPGMYNVELTAFRDVGGVTLSDSVVIVVDIPEPEIIIEP